MRANLPFAERSFMAMCIKLAQTTFFDVLPARPEARPGAVPANQPSDRQPERSPRWIAWLDNWFHAQALKEREAYLAQSTDIFDLENRMRRLQGRPYY